MARMVPDRLRRTTSAAEELLYGKFQRELPAEYTVVHGARWVGRRHGRRGEDGEIDFVVLHPREGILVLEAKSGEVFRDGPTGRWVQRVGGREEEIQSPVEQAESGKHTLRALFERMPGVARRRLHLVHGVALPFHQAPAAGLGLDLPRERLLDQAALHNVTSFVRRALESADARRQDLPDLGEEGVAKIVDALAPRRELRLHLGALADAMHERLVRLTDEQLDRLEWIAARERGWICGGPGTGKTLLAAELARRFAQSGDDVLLVCFNGPLAGLLCELTADVAGVTTLTFHDMCRRYASEAGLPTEPPAGVAQSTWFGETLPDLLLEAARRTARRHGVIVVDEGQDLQTHWWIALEAWLAEGRAGRLYVFSDDSQRLYRNDGGIPADDLGLGAPLPLRVVSRCTDELFAALDALAPEGLALRPGGTGSGRRPGLTVVPTVADLEDATARVVARLVADGLRPADLVVLTPRSQAKSVLGAATRFAHTPAGWRDRPEDGVLIETVHRFKGLESRGVVLTELEAGDNLERLLWVGISRAQTVLEVVATASARPALAPALDAFDVHRP